jgi:hypothetical protein
MRWFTKNFAGPFARLMAASWLLQVVFPVLCCCSCLSSCTATAYGSDKVLSYSVPCCCQTLFSRLGVTNQVASPYSVMECQGTTCPNCDSCSCYRASDSRPSTHRRRQLEGSEKLIVNLVLACPGDSFGGDSQWSVPSRTDACDKGAALSAAERCVSLQRLVL